MNILVVIFCVLAVFCFGYYAFAASYAGMTSSFLWFWVLAGIGFVFLGISVFMHRKYHIFDVIPKAVKIIFVSAVCIGIIVFATMEGMILSKMHAATEDEVDYVIVLGAQVRGEKITKSLKKRLEAAYEYLLTHEDVKVVCAGGQGPGEDISEAFAMKRYLMEKGIDEKRIVTEDKSVSTYENLKFSLVLIGDKNARVLVVTNNFHVYRAIHLAKYVGFKNVNGMAAKSDNKLILNYMVREGLALFKELLVH